MRKQESFQVEQKLTLTSPEGEKQHSASNILLLSSFILLLLIATINVPYIKLRILAHSLVDFSLPSESTKKVILLIGCKREPEHASGETGSGPQLAPTGAKATQVETQPLVHCQYLSLFFNSGFLYFILF